MNSIAMAAAAELVAAAGRDRLAGVKVIGIDEHRWGRRRLLGKTPVESTGAELHKHYRPGTWLPHCSLAPRATLAQLPVVAAAVLDVLPLPVTLDRAGEISPQSPLL